MLPRLFAAVVLVSSAALTAQSSVYLPDNLTSQKPCNAIPFGSYGIHEFPTNLKYQTIVPWASLSGLARPVIEEIGFASCADGIGSFKSIKIQMAQTARTQLVPEFAKNLGQSPVAVLDTVDYYWHQSKDTWCRIGLQRPFSLTPGEELVIDIEVTGAVFLSPLLEPSESNVGGHRAAAPVPRLFAIGWKSAAPPTGKLKGYGLKLELSANISDLSLFGIGCKGAGTKRPALGLSGTARPSGTVNVVLADALPFGATLLVLGFDNKAPFPVPLGFPDCSLYHSVALALPATADQAGKLTIPIVLPASAVLQNQRFYAQFFQVEVTRSGLGLRATNYGRVLIR